MNPSELEIKFMPMADLSPDPANARLHSDRNIEAVVGSLRRFGQQKPIVIDSDGIIRAGNGTFQAATKLGWERIAVVQTDLEGAEATAYAIADNRAGELATWDQDVLAKSLIALKGEGDGQDGLDGTGFSGGDLQALFGGLPIPEGEEGAIDAGDWGEDGYEDRDLPTSGVRMVQLFLDESGLEEYTSMVGKLASRLGTQNQTETVMEVLRGAITPINDAVKNEDDNG